MTQTKDPETREFQLRSQIEQLKGQVGTLREALNYLLKHGLSPESRDRAYKAIEGARHDQA